jgi:adenosylcobinamide kinase / adenosylcobinamide-phosphate guanylyltransferase
MHAHLLVLGGARSGKSRYAEVQAAALGCSKLYLATAEAFDDEMRARIARHRADRAQDHWVNIEEPLELVARLSVEARPDRVVLVDCLTLWLNNLLHVERDEAQECAKLVACLPYLAGPVIFVSNEVGLGLVPSTPLGRRFRDAQGRLNQMMAASVPRAVFIAAGLPLILKG